MPWSELKKKKKGKKGSADEAMEKERKRAGKRKGHGKKSHTSPMKRQKVLSMPRNIRGSRAKQP